MGWKVVRLLSTTVANGRPQRRAVEVSSGCVCLFHTYYYAENVLMRKVPRKDLVRRQNIIINRPHDVRSGV